MNGYSHVDRARSDSTCGVQIHSQTWRWWKDLSRSQEAEANHGNGIDQKHDSLQWSKSFFVTGLGLTLLEE